MEGVSNLTTSSAFSRSFTTLLWMYGIGPGPPAFDGHLEQEHQEVLCLHHGDCESALSLSHGQVLEEEGQDYEEAREAHEEECR